MISPEQIYDLLNFWKQNTYLSNQTLTYNEDIYTQALSMFKYDYERWYPDSEMEVSKIVFTPQLQAVLTYRIAHLFHKNGGGIDADVISLIGRINGLMEIYYSSEIGVGLKINHGIGTVIGARSKMGNNCMLHQGVILGDKNGGRPTIGNNVIIYAGAQILGDIYIGDNSIIGANSVVLTSFPEHSIIVGAPAKNIKK